jgi:hypothetical protein
MHRRLCAAVCLLGTICLAGCGQSLHSVKGVVTLDGNPVEGATVSFVSEDRKTVCDGHTDASGNFELFTGGKPGAPSGSFKVVVTKTKPVPGGEQMTPGGTDYVKQMQKEQAEGKGKGGGLLSGPGMMKGPGMAKGFSGSTGPKTELPSVYASADSTPITITLPPDKSPVTVELKSKP